MILFFIGGLLVAVPIALILASSTAVRQIVAVVAFVCLVVAAPWLAIPVGLVVLALALVLRRAVKKKRAEQAQTPPGPRSNEPNPARHSTVRHALHSPPRALCCPWCGGSVELRDMFCRICGHRLHG